MKAAIRADASTAIGSGHVMRCLSLAQELRCGGAEVSFICRELSGAKFEAVRNSGHHLHLLPPLRPTTAANDELVDADQCASILTTIGKIDWLVVDHYGLGRAWEQRLRPYAKRVMVIDDLANRRHDCDLLLDQNLADDSQERYRDLVGSETLRLIGPRYALLREEFRSRLRRERNGQVRRILVFFGGADTTNETRKAVDAIALLGRRDIAVDVVVGEMNQRYDEIEAACRRIAQCRVHRGSDMAALMASADLAIGAGGTTAWERCALGLPAIAWAVADNQRVVIDGLVRLGALYEPDPASIHDAEGLAKHIYAMINNPSLLSAMSQRASTVCDGRGAERVVAAMQDDVVTVRRAIADDCRRVYEWRNHPSIRTTSLNTAEIEWDEHERWFRDALRGSDRALLLGYAGERPIGVIRFDLINRQPAEVSIYVDPALTNRGLGLKLLRAGEEWLAANVPQVRATIAKVRPDNAASVRLFESGGYQEAYRVYRKERSA